MILSNHFRTARAYLFICFIFIPTAIFAESTAIVKGRVTDSKNRPIEFATATLLNSSTKELFKGQTCNGKGEFVIEKVKPGEYILAITMVGYSKSESEKLTINPNSRRVVEKNVVLTELSHQLGKVEVVSKKKYIEQTVDKVIINPEASITSASESVYEILKKLPGVTIDNNENISLKGKQGVMVLLDEKPTYVSADQLATLLKSMQGKSIDRIEIMENPPARYDAEGNAGIINIKTKHNRAPGFNGNVNTGLNITNKLCENGGFDLNMNFGKLNIYGNYSFYDWRRWNALDATRRFISTDLAGSYQFIDARDDYNGNAHNYKVGADYFLRKNHVISFMFRGNSGFNINSGNNLTTFADLSKNVDSTLTTYSNRNDNWDSKTYNVDYKWNIDSVGRSLSLDADYGHFYFNSNSDQNSNSFDRFGDPTDRIFSVNTVQGGAIDVLSARVDYVHPINKIYNFEAGLKSSLVTTDSKVNMVGFLNQVDNFIFKENIQSAYINGRAKFNKFSFQLGLRLENTNSKGTSVSMNQIDKKTYLKLFPSLYMQQTLNANNTLNFRYSYRIGRPNYNKLNPFIRMFDPYTYIQGNPLLKPQFTHSTSLSHSYKGIFITSFGYNYTKDLFTEVHNQDDATKVIYETMKNMSNCLDFNASETLQLQPTKWWNVNATFTGLYNEINSKLGESTQFKRWIFMGNLSNSFILSPKMNMELSGYYTSKQLHGNMVRLNNYCINLGFQRKILNNNNGVIKVSFNDILNTSNGGSYTKHSNINLEVINKSDSRRLNLSFSYRFGKNNFKTRANRSTASSEEESRSAK